MMLSAALFIIGVAGVMIRRNIIIIFMSIELILNAVNINLVAYASQQQNVVGQVFAIFVIAVAAAEAAVGLGIILAFYRNKETVNIDEMNLMRWSRPDRQERQDRQDGKTEFSLDPPAPPALPAPPAHLKHAVHLVNSSSPGLGGRDQRSRRDPFVLAEDSWLPRVHHHGGGARTRAGGVLAT